MGREKILGLIRHILTFGGGFLASSGVLDASTIETATGAVITLIGVVWSAFAPEKKQAEIQRLAGK